MHIRILSFCTLVLGIQVISALGVRMEHTLELNHIAALCDTTDHESLLACGMKIPLSTADQFALELIPGVSESNAKGILKMREKILSQAQVLEPHEQYRALLIVKGIGVKKGWKIGSYIKFF